jgi:hypothetical protein
MLKIEARPRYVGNFGFGIDANIKRRECRSGMPYFQALVVLK